MGFRVSSPVTATGQLVAVTVAVYLAQLAWPSVTERFSLEADWFRRPWQFYQLLTYGFLHSPRDVWHIIGNMLVLWFFGRDLETRMGRAEFLTFYLTAIVIAGAVWTLSEMSFGSRAAMLGASGGISGLFALYALFYPHRQVLFMMVLPMPMWLAALIGIGWDVKGAMARTGNVACTAHLAGAVFGLWYYKLNVQLSRALGWLNPFAALKRPRLRVHEPEPEGDDSDPLSARVDEILQKIQEQGQESLTAAERRTLERASRRYQQKRR
jgi:membrane associated rhomboid family serine protease